MSVRVDKVESDVLSELGQSIQPAGWWERRRAPEELAARDADKLLNEYGKDAYWLACLAERRSSAERAHHWHAVATEIERRTGRRSPATPGQTTGSLRESLNQLYVPPDADLPRFDAYRAGAHDRADNFHLGAVTGPHYEEMYDDPPRKVRRRGLVTALALIGCVMAGAAGVYAYRTYYVVQSSTQTAAVPSQAEPAQPAVRGYLVQVSIRRTKADAEASFRSLQSKFPRQLGGRTAMIERADLGAKGIYYRTMVGPFASAGAADQFCSSLKAAGGQCVIQRE
jgi:SPOR domain